MTLGVGLVLATLLAQPPVPRHAKLDPLAQPKLLLKDAVYLIHAIPTKGLAVVHTTIATGEMRVLASGDVSVTVLAMAYDQTIIEESRIAGVAADKEQIYVLKWRGRARAGTYQLLAFRLRDGKLLASTAVKGDGVPKEAPTATSDTGPLRLNAKGVSLFGTTFELRGSDLIRQVPEKKP